MVSLSSLVEARRMTGPWRCRRCRTVHEGPALAFLESFTDAHGHRTRRVIGFECLNGCAEPGTHASGERGGAAPAGLVQPPAAALTGSPALRLRRAVGRVLAPLAALKGARYRWRSSLEADLRRGAFEATIRWSGQRYVIACTCGKWEAFSEASDTTMMRGAFRKHAIEQHP